MNSASTKLVSLAPDAPWNGASRRWLGDKYIYIKILISDFNPFINWFQLNNFTDFSNKVLLYSEFLDKSRDVFGLARSQPVFLQRFDEVWGERVDVDDMEQILNFVENRAFQSWKILYTFVIRVRRNTPLIEIPRFTRKQLYKIFANFERSYLPHFPTFWNQTLYFN